MMGIRPSEEAVAEWLWRCSWQTAVLVALVVAAQWMFRRQLTPAWRFGLWLLVLIRLTMPALPASPASVFRLIEPFSDPSGEHGKSGVLHYEIQAPETTSRVAGSKDASTEPGTAVVAMPRPTGHWFQGLCLWIWASGVLCYFGRVLSQNVWFAAQLPRRSHAGGIEQRELLERCKLELGVGGSLTLLETSLVSSPALYGWFRPKLLLPEGAGFFLSASESRHVFLHELAHVKRGDMAVNWLMVILQGVHWFNPFVWLAFSRMRADCELACDALALSLAADERRSYGETILKLLEGPERPAYRPGLIGILATASQMRRRITEIAEFRKGNGRAPLACALIAGLGLAGLTDARTQSPLENQGAGMEPTSQTDGEAADGDHPIKVEVVALDAETRTPVKISMLRVSRWTQPQELSVDSSFSDPRRDGAGVPSSFYVERGTGSYWLTVGAPDHEALATEGRNPGGRRHVMTFLLRRTGGPGSIRP